jgi:hypothetical protein
MTPRRPLFFGFIHSQYNTQLHLFSKRKDHLIAALDHAQLVAAGGLIVGVDNGARVHTVGVVRLGPGVDGVNVGVGVEEEGEHFCAQQTNVRITMTVPPLWMQRH